LTPRRREARAAAAGGDPEVLLDGEVGQDPAALGDQGHPGAGDQVGGAAGQLPALEADAAGAGAEQAHDRRQQGRPAGPVAAEQSDGPALADGQVDAVQDGAAAVAGPQSLHLQQGGHLVPSKNRSSRAASPR
jgi:hypothetical protein